MLTEKEAMIAANKFVATLEDNDHVYLIDTFMEGAKWAANYYQEKIDELNKEIEEIQNRVYE